MASTIFTRHLRDVLDGVDVILSDIWGVVHNGLQAWPDACAALAEFRQGGADADSIVEDVENDESEDGRPAPDHHPRGQ